MKILLVTYWFLPHVGGVNTYINVLRDELIRNGHEVDVLAHYTKKNDKIYMLTNGQFVDKSKIKKAVYEIVFQYYEQNQPYVESWIRWREIERYSFELALSLFNLEQYDIIHAQDIISSRALARVKPDHVPLVSTIHGFLASEHRIAGNIKSTKSIAWKYVHSEELYGATAAQRTIVPTYWLTRLFTDKKVNVPPSQLSTIPYGIDIKKFMQQYRSPISNHFPSISKRKTILLCVARMVHVKGHHILLEALALLKKKRSDFVCLLVGDGHLMHSLRSLSRRLNLERHIYFLGDRDDVPQLIRRSDILVLPSIQDNHPFTVMEGQIAGKLVIASNAGGIPEMIYSGKTGLLFPNRNSRKLAKRIDYALTYPKRRKKIARQGKQWGLKQWAPSTLAQKTLDIYERAVKHTALELIDSNDHELDFNEEVSSRIKLPISDIHTPVPPTHEITVPKNNSWFSDSEIPDPAFIAALKKAHRN